jgi:type IV pilus assembly protein PilO
MAPRAQKPSALERMGVAAKVGVTMIAMAVAVGVYLILFYTDVDGQISATIQKTGTLRGELTAAQDAQAAYQKDFDEKAKCEKLEDVQKKILPDEGETAAFLAAIQGVATTAGVTLTSWSPLDESPAEFYSRVPMKLSLRGRFHQMARFFHGVGQLDRVINVENISMSSKGADGGEVEVDCLATAFRALGGKKGSANPNRGGRK